MALSHQKASTSAHLRKYHVFLSFRGDDVRTGFLKDLDVELQAQAIGAFKDDRALQKGSSIGKELMLAIEQSRFAIVIVSKNYAESPWCLSELAHMVQCMQESGRIMPIFYEVDPGDVRHQTGIFAQHFTKHENKYGQDAKQVREWKDALTQLGNLSGWDSKNFRDKDVLIKHIVDLVWEKVHDPKVKLGSIQNPAGRAGKLKKIDLLLNPDANDVRIIGIWGTDETCNKTTAEFVHNRNYDKFEASSILSDIRTNALRKGLVYLQEKLLTDLNRTPIKVENVIEGKNMIRSFVHNKKFLLILDDADQRDQPPILGGEKDWYAEGSRIIITTTNKELLVELGIKEPYLLEGLAEDEVLQSNN